jgi:NAD(P)-dependent dehydrogenase (short-subunit alcohol dehydrogenase family)
MHGLLRYDSLPSSPSLRLWLTLSAQFGKSRGITVNSVAPGPVGTDILPSEKEVLDELTRPLVDVTRAADRIGTTADIADITLLLVSEKARWVTGQHVSASGGITGQ